MLKINGNSYKEAEIDFNAICELEDMGVKLFNLKDASGAKIARAYLALCMGGATRLDVAGAEINQHVINGGKFEDITDAFAKAVQESGFFQALQARTKAGNRESKEAQDPQAE